MGFSENGQKEIRRALAPIPNTESTSTEIRNLCCKIALPEPPWLSDRPPENFALLAAEATEGLSRSLPALPGFLVEAGPGEEPEVYTMTVAERDRLVRLLESIEWSPRNGECPTCGMVCPEDGRPGRHTPNCELAAVLEELR